jgi:RimJ/RimL family protein N-acetyltransferase
MSIIVKTQRLELRQFSLSDSEGFFLLNKDPEVVKYTGDRAFKSIEETRNFIEKYDHYQKMGFGRWSVYHKVSQDYLGFCGLKFSPDKQEVDLGFRFLRKYWNQGFATESARAALKIGFGKYKLQKIVGRAMMANIASHSVLLKLGMKKRFEFEEEGEKWAHYEIDIDHFI